ncbi:hypothetical protein [Kribbella solani]|uniref:Uncharacterized protein n=1 Tax=Kribbella solani TaxID=236067 RepID=A0A841DNE7_9ACTN|nr:hypothetical protein [Kribbella solani]MBB5978515.1 hypothetical protein [Kribbella solani]
MRLRGRDVVALILLGSVLATYSGYLGYGEIAMIHTARAMASVGLILGGIAFVVIRGGHRPGRLGRAEGGAAVVAVVLYAVTVGLAETSAAELLLAAFLLCLILVFALDLLDSSGTRHELELHR